MTRIRGRSGWLRCATRTLALTALWCSFGCKAGEAKDKPLPPVLLDAKRDVEPPVDYLGPIDPEWPPRRNVELEVELRASKLIRDRLGNGEGTIDIAPLPADHEKGIFVETGRIGVFSYLEVIVGHPVHPDDPLPLVVLLHGRGNRPQIPQGPLEASIPFRMFIPQAPDVLGDGYTWLAIPTKDPNAQLFARSLSGRVDQLAPAIEAFRRLRPTLGKPILIGFSQGGIMTYALATRFPHHFGAAFPMAGWLPPALYPERKPGRTFPYIFAQHGGADDVVATTKGRETVKALRARGLAVDYREFPGVGHVVSPAMSDEIRRAVRRILTSYQGSVRSLRPASNGP
jgi:phospholipase/carboxylesterase